MINFLLVLLDNSGLMAVVRVRCCWRLSLRLQHYSVVVTALFSAKKLVRLFDSHVLFLIIVMRPTEQMKQTKNTCFSTDIAGTAVLSNTAQCLCGCLGDCDAKYKYSESTPSRSPLLLQLQYFEQLMVEFVVCASLSLVRSTATEMAIYGTQHDSQTTRESALRSNLGTWLMAAKPVNP